MKKFLLLVFSLSVLAVLSACSDSGSSNNGGGTQTPIDVNALEGTYNIEFFYTDGAGIVTLATDCSKVTEYLGANAKQCANPTTDSLAHKGEGTIQVNADGSVKIQTKVQVNGSAFDSGLGAFAAGNKFNFTDFPLIPASAITSNYINDNSVASHVKGTNGRNAIELTPSPKSTYQFSVLADGTVVNNMVDTSSGVPANVMVRMKKKDSVVATLDANTAYDTPAIDNFNANGEITYTPAN